MIITWFVYHEKISLCWAKATGLGCRPTEEISEKQIVRMKQKMEIKQNLQNAWIIKFHPTYSKEMKRNSLVQFFNKELFS